jgi:peptidoglycan/xylan/chitin deacetylase (PgdA/CDA1 family)
MVRRFWVWVTLLLCLVPAGAAAQTADACGVADGFQGLRRTDPFPRGEVVLTFDDGPQPKATARLLELLEEERLPATFFVVGVWIRADTYQLIARMVASGHEVGNHTYSHDELLTRRGWGIDYVQGQYALTHVLIELSLLATSPSEFGQLYRRVIGSKPGRPLSPAQVRARWRSIEQEHFALLAERGYEAGRRVYPLRFLRPPGGIPYEGRWPQSMRDEHAAAALRLGLRTVLWHGISGDTVRGRLNDATFLQRNVRFHSQRGGVLLFHDRMRRDAMKHALHQLATDPGLRVVSLGSAVDAKYACQPSTVASR